MFRSGALQSLHQSTTRMSSYPAYTNDSYYVTTGGGARGGGVTKDLALVGMQEKIRVTKKWMSGSGLMVNIT